MSVTMDGLGHLLRDVFDHAARSEDRDLQARTINTARVALLEIPNAYRSDALMRVAHVETWSDIGATLHQAQGS